MAIFEIERLLRNGFIPRELPPCFNTNDLADHSADVLRATRCINPKSSIPLTYSGFKSETARRKFAIANPYHFCKAASEIVDGEAEIKRILSKSNCSLRAPISGNPTEGESYAMRSTSPAETRAAVEKLYRNNRIEIRLDINSCFDSIYTHTIPWAIHGVTTAKKKRRDMSLLGNRLDSSMQAMNYEQTNGILIGNDLSRIISEIILCTVDAQILNKLPHLSYCRFVDDYYIYAKDASQTQQIIAVIRTELAKFQLTLNENKVQINESPFLYGKQWLVGMQQALQLKSNDFLSWLINKYKNEKDPALLRYGLHVIDARRFSPLNRWDAMQSRILNIWVRYPFLSDRILPLLWNNKAQLGKRELKTAIYTVIDQSILLRQDLELIWAVWFTKVFEIPISQEYAIKVLQSENELSIIIMFDILAGNGLNKKSSIQREYRTLLQKLKEADSDDGKAGQLPWTSHWLLAYEAERCDRFRSISETLGIMRSDPFFMKLLKKDIKFYDPSFLYTENQFLKESKKTKKLKQIQKYVNTADFKQDFEKDSQATSAQFMRMMEDIMDVY